MNAVRRWLLAGAVAAAIVGAADACAVLFSRRVVVPFPPAMWSEHPPLPSALMAELQRYAPTVFVPPRWLGAARLMAYVAAGLTAFRIVGRARRAIAVIVVTWVAEAFGAVATSSPAYAGAMQPLLGAGAVALAARMLRWERREEARSFVPLLPDAGEDGVLDPAVAMSIGRVTVPPDFRPVRLPDDRRGAYRRRVEP